MSPEQIRDLALTLCAIIVECYDVAEPQAVCDRCIRACQARGLEPAAAVIISGPPPPPHTASVTRRRACRKFPGVRQLGDALYHPGGVTLAGTADAA
jgi:hypothetical protein